MVQGKGKHQEELRLETKGKILEFLDEYTCAKPAMIAKQIKTDKRSVHAALEELVKENKIKKENLPYLDNRKKKIPYYFSHNDPRMYRILVDNECRQIFGDKYFKGIRNDVSLDAQYGHKINFLVKERDHLRKKLNEKYKKIEENKDRAWGIDPYKIKEPLQARKILLLQFQKITSDELNKRLTKFQGLQSVMMAKKICYQNDPVKMKTLDSDLREWLISIDDLHEAFIQTNSKKMFSDLSKIFVVNKLLEETIGHFANIFGLSSKTISKIKNELYLDDGSVNIIVVNKIFRKYTDRRIYQGSKLGPGFYLELKREITESGKNG